MSTLQPTYDDIMRLLQEIAIRSQETDRQIKEVAEQSKETDRQFKETDRQFKETDRQFKETDRKIKEVTTSIGKLGNRLGDFIEDAVRPVAVRLFKERGIEVHEVYQNVTMQRDGEGLEIDLLVVNDGEAVGVECKSNLKVDDVNEHLERLAKLKRVSPKYRHYKLMGALAAMVIPDNVARYAMSKGLFVIGQSGEHLEIRNDAGFEPAVW
ncbi:MAG: DUF3782 domain-containing protein [Proteobacteria bacterium]|nr:DUF3782 domain-containing protein [Pseudomonadota bacterium]